MVVASGLQKALMGYNNTEQQKIVCTTAMRNLIRYSYLQLKAKKIDISLKVLSNNTINNK
jgi:hypothetical protein